MQRRRVIKFLSAGVLMTTLGSFKKITDHFEEQDETMPALFVGHGSPMNAIEDNEFSRGWKLMAASLPRPQAILCISAHWETRGSLVTVMEKPRTIHDFGGFPKALFDVQYPAPGNPALAKETITLIENADVQEDTQWGLDHGCWSVVSQMYPGADIPVVQLSMDYTKSPEWHYETGTYLSSLRKKGVLILCSGNVVHNLGLLNWNMISGGGFDWALEANDILKGLIEKGDHKGLSNYKNLGKAVNLAIPTPEHFLPILYLSGVRQKNDKLSFFNDKAVGGSLTMTSVTIG